MWLDGDRDIGARQRITLARIAPTGNMSGLKGMQQPIVTKRLGAPKRCIWTQVSLLRRLCLDRSRARACCDHSKFTRGPRDRLGSGGQGGMPRVVRCSLRPLMLRASNSAIMSKPQPGRGPKDLDSATRAENPEEELSSDERRISLRVKIPAEDGTVVVEMTVRPCRRMA